MRGNISVAYTAGADFTMTLTVPAATTARVTLPRSDYETILLNGKAVYKREESQACLDSSEREQARSKIKPVSIDNLSALGKGTYQIVAK